MKKQYNIGESYWYLDARGKIYNIKICSSHDFDKGVAQFDTKEQCEQYVLEELMVTEEWLIHNGFVNTKNLPHGHVWEMPEKENEDQIVFIEKEFSRNMFCVILDGEHVLVKVQIDAGCGFHELQHMWWGLSVSRLNDFYSGFHGKKIGE